MGGRLAALESGQWELFMTMRILVVDDEEAMREVLNMRLDQWGYSVQVAQDASEAQKAIRTFKPEIVISDVVMPEVSGLEFLKSLQEGEPHRAVILITAHGTVDMAVEAMKEGARDFLTKPIDYSKLKALLDAVEDEIRLRRDSRKLVSKIEKGSGFGPFVGTSKPMRELYELIKKLAATDASVLITGESGTGKELVARTLHDLSGRSEGPFIALNMAAIPSELMESEIFGHEKGAFTGAADVREGCFELAHGGTLLMDEIAEMPAALQPKLLRVLEDGIVRRLGGKREFNFDARVLASTNRDPQLSVKEGRLREDLYYRLNVFTVDLPPLRERKGDIPLLAQHFVGEFNRKHGALVEGLREETSHILESYSWPGNVRELRNIMERAVVLARKNWIEPSHLPPYLYRAEPEAADKIVLSVGISAADAEKALILRTLEKAENNKAKAARWLGVDVKTIRNKLKAYGID